MSATRGLAQALVGMVLLALLAASVAGGGRPSSRLQASGWLALEPVVPALRAQQAPRGSSAEAVAIGDVTGDHRNDLVLVTSFNNSPKYDFRLWVFAQTPSGALASPVIYPTAATYPNRAESLAVGDATGDGRADVLLAVRDVGVQVFPQQRSGRLGSPTTVGAAGDSYVIALGRLNGDRNLDLAAVGFSTETASVALNGSGTIGSPSSYSARHEGFEDLEVADVTGDGRDDLVLMSGQGYEAPNLSVLAQLPEGGFGPPAEYRLAGRTLTHGLGVGDVTGDGRQDVVLSSGFNAPAYITVFAQRPDGTLASPVSHRTHEFPAAVEVRDFNRDHHADVVVRHSDRIGVYLQLRGGRLSREQFLSIPPGTSVSPQSVAIGDLNADGAPDLALADGTYGPGVFWSMLGRPHCVVPKVLGQSLRMARRSIARAHCSLGRVRQRQSSAGRRLVQGQRPRAGKRLPRGSAVNLVLGG
ncbi:MAG: FG-GAP-like repeat-containing protein [Actinomycetota bacterium]|nr:FG-GAP-like repeat-containing protein [Actinomycetota bacterium]